MKYTIAIGDIHGCLNTLQSLLTKINTDFGDIEYKLVFLGDYVDRGKYSKEVVELIRELVGQGHIALKGNHEQIFIDNHEDMIKLDIDSYQYGVLSSYNATYRSYGTNYNLIREHAYWFRQLPTHHEDKFRYYVHAGINPNYPLNDQVENDKIWIRYSFLYYPDKHEKLIVHGHTVEGKDIPTFKTNRIGLDTGCVFEGTLSAVVFDDIIETPVKYYSEPYNPLDGKYV